MAPETWLVKVKAAISRRFEVSRTAASNFILSQPFVPRLSRKKHSQQVAVLAFEISALMSKLIHLWQALMDKNLVQLRNNSISLEGVRKIVSNDESFLLGLACAEMVETLRLVSQSVSRLSQRCEDAKLRSFEEVFREFAESGRDPNNWVLSWKEMEARKKTMEKYVSLTSLLYKEMEELNLLENTLKKSMNEVSFSGKTMKDQKKVVDLQRMLVWQEQEVKFLRDKSLWNRSYDTVVSLLVRFLFTVMARIKNVFGLRRHGLHHLYPKSLPRSLSASAAVHPSYHNPANFSTSSFSFVGGPFKAHQTLDDEGISTTSKESFLETNCRLLKPPVTTLGATGLAFHYANVIIVIEKMIRSPQLVGIDARDDLYSMLPGSIRSLLRGRLKGVGLTSTEPALAGEWKDAVGRILGWLSPLANNMIKWQSERNFEQQSNMATKIIGSINNVLLLQTLVFANKEKTEAAITELLVGLNYIWRFEIEATAKALLKSAAGPSANQPN